MMEYKLDEILYSFYSESEINDLIDAILREDNTVVYNVKKTSESYSEKAIELINKTIDIVDDKDLDEKDRIILIRILETLKYGDDAPFKNKLDIILGK